jgi:hypothetical protein
MFSLKEFIQYLKDMAVLVNRYRSLVTRGTSEDDIVSKYIGYYATKIEYIRLYNTSSSENTTISYDETSKTLSYLLDNIRKRLVQINKNVITASTERAKIYTSIYSTILVYMKIKNKDKWTMKTDNTHESDTVLFSITPEKSQETFLQSGAEVYNKRYGLIFTKKIAELGDGIYDLLLDENSYLNITKKNALENKTALKTSGGRKNKKTRAFRKHSKKGLKTRKGRETKKGAKKRKGRKSKRFRK